MLRVPEMPRETKSVISRGPMIRMTVEAVPIDHDYKFKCAIDRRSMKA